MTALIREARIPHFKGYQNAHRLGQDSSQSRTGSAHVEGTDQQIVESNIDRTGDGDKIHRAFRISESAKDRADNIVSRNERNADKTDRQISSSSGNRFCRGGHCRNNGPYAQKQDCSGSNGQNEKQDDRIADSCGRILLLFCTDSLAYHNGRSHCQSYDHYCRHMHDLTADRDSGRAFHAVKLSDNE